MMTKTVLKGPTEGLNKTPILLNFRQPVAPTVATGGKATLALEQNLVALTELHVPARGLASSIMVYSIYHSEKAPARKHLDPLKTAPGASNVM